VRKVCKCSSEQSGTNYKIIIRFHRIYASFCMMFLQILLIDDMNKKSYLSRDVDSLVDVFLLHIQVNFLAKRLAPHGANCLDEIINFKKLTPILTARTG
jgi:hypothetical protein